MDVERTIEFLIKNAAQSDARFNARMDRADARMDRLEKGLKHNKTLTMQLIALMSQQTAHHAKLSRETDRRFAETDKQIQETDKQIKAMTAALHAFLAASGRSNGHGKKQG